METKYKISIFLKYYSIFSRQAQNDVAFFVESMTKNYEFTGPWIAFGGSYPGSMVAWAREKYPHLIKGGVSSSGPLLAKVKLTYLMVSYLSVLLPI